VEHLWHLRLLVPNKVVAPDVGRSFLRLGDDLWSTPYPKGSTHKICSRPVVRVPRGVNYLPLHLVLRGVLIKLRLQDRAKRLVGEVERLPGVPKVHLARTFRQRGEGTVVPVAIARPPRGRGRRGSGEKRGEGD
jgi:hypothetical protein